MNKLHSFAVYALAAPVIALGAGSVLAQQSTGQDAAREQQRTERGQDASKSTAGAAQGDQKTQRAGQADSKTEADRRGMGEQSRMESRGYMDKAPTSGLRASDLIGADVNTTGDEDVGPVNDLIIDENGQVVAIVVGVGGFLGMGEKDVAIGWDDVTRSGGSDELELRVNVTREDLRSAPTFESRD